MNKMTTAIAAPSPDDEKRAVELENAALRAAGFDRVDPATRTIAAEVAKKYGLELMLRHLLPIEGRPYVTRDGLLHVAHKSGQLDGIVVEEEGESGPGAWWAKVSVYRKDMKHPFTFRGRYSGSNKRYGPEMAVKCAEVMGLRRAFDVALPTVEEQGLDPADVSVRPAAKEDESVPSVEAEVILPVEKEGPQQDNPEVVSAKRRTPRVAEGVKPTASKVEAATDWKKSLPSQLEGGFFIRSGDMREDASPVTAETLAAMAKNVVNHWTSPNGDLAEVTRVKGQLNMYGYFTDPAMEAESRQCFENFFDTAEELDKAIRTPRQEGAPSALQVAKTNPAALEKIVRENSQRGQMARHAMKVAAEEKSKPAPAKAAAPSPAKAAAAKAKAVATKKSPAEVKKETRTNLLLAAHKDAGKEIDADTLASYLEAGDSLDDDDFESFCLDVVKDE